MRDQFAGDITDWLKFSLLRTLAADDRSIGVAWYYIEDCAEAKLEDLDAEVADALAAYRERSVSALERLACWKSGTKFFRKHVPHPQFRNLWLEEMRSSLNECDIVFLDPDNGLGNPDALHATLDEIAAMRKSGRTIVLIHFPNHTEKQYLQIASHQEEIARATEAESVFTIKTGVTVQRQNPYGANMRLHRSRWFTVIDGDEVIRNRAKEFVAKLKKTGCSASIEPEY
jgi:hypothetical protein